MNSINSIYNYFSEKKEGHISIISSVAGYRGLPVAGAYCASKSALISFAESNNENIHGFPLDEIFKGLTKKNIFEIHFQKQIFFKM